MPGWELLIYNKNTKKMRIEVEEEEKIEQEQIT